MKIRDLGYIRNVQLLAYKKRSIPIINTTLIRDETEFGKSKPEGNNAVGGIILEPLIRRFRLHEPQMSGVETELSNVQITKNRK